MKRTLGLLIFTLAIVGCQKAPDSTRIGASNARSNNVAGGATSTPSGVTLNGLVTTDASYQDQFEDEVKDFMEGSVDPDVIGTVSAIGANQTGVYVGGKVELANGQPLQIPTNSRIDITPNSEILVAVYDKFSDQANLAPLPPVYLKQSSGYVSGNNVYIDFYDARGHITLEGTFDNNVTKLKFAFSTDLTYENKVGYKGTMGDLRVPTCSFFRCH